MYYLNDINNGLFVKALVVDLYYIGILKLCTKSRGFGNISERAGNIRMYNIKLKRVIENTIGLTIPIVKPEDLALGKDISNYTLKTLFDIHELNFQFAIIDIVVKNNRGAYISIKTERKLLCELAAPLWNPSYGKYSAKTIENLELPIFIELFLKTWQYYFTRGTTQNSINDETFIDLCNYKFYKGVNFRISFSKISHGPTTYGETDSLHLHTYGDVKEYYWQSPRLVMNTN